MKQKKLFHLLALLLLCFPQMLFAQKSDAFSKMRPGDWFEVLVSDADRDPNDESYRFNIRYTLKEVDAAGNKTYMLSFERIRIIISATSKSPLGYDSYYPPYQQGIQQKPLRPGFTLDVDKTGKVLSAMPEYDFPLVNLYQIGPVKTDMIRSVQLKPVYEESAILISQFILTAIAHNEKDWYSGQIYKDTGLRFVLADAAFPMASNVLIEGNIKNIDVQMMQPLTLNLQGVKREFHIAKDGSFRMTAFVTEGTDASLNYSSLSKRLSIPLILSPGDTLRIHADAGRLIESLQFSGRPAKMAEFGLELAKFAQTKKSAEIPYGATSFSAKNLMEDQIADESTFRRLVEKYNQQLSDDVLIYHHLKFAFESAKERLDFLSKTNYKSSPQSQRFGNFPKDFFKGIDTLPVLMNNYNTAAWNTSFLYSFQFYMTSKDNQFNGGSQGFFLGSYVSSLNHLRRFPLYFALTGAFENEFMVNSWKTAQTLKPYYDDFINNCGDTALTNLVQQKWQALAAWAPGNPMPLKNIKLSDGSLLDLNQFKGKVLSITFNFHNPEQMGRLLNRIKNQDPKKVHFLIVQLKLKGAGYPASSITEELKKLPQVSYVEVTNLDKDLEKVILADAFDIKTFVLDADQRIIQDNINESPNTFSQDKVFEEVIQKALAPKTMSKEDKAELIKITGWSIGSILFASLIFLWIYKARISAIRRKESLVRQIKELEIKAIRSQMNPHFMFNALNSIQSLINNKQYKEANIYLEKFSLLMRRVLNNSEKTFVSLSDEIEAVSLYAELEKLRFDFIFSITIDKEINTDLTEIPGMIIQPLVENAIIHGIAQKGSKGILEILITKEPGYLSIQVIDNGKGLIAKAAEKQDGFGLKLVRERLNLLNAQGAEGALKINSNSGDAAAGVTATLTIPID
ncbi:sensor histidine kinase [Pedobacter metabolipauper]|uniref:Histidine kinase n=1 Tax=Pedobacter metabolipauper TaxID=425513 RepID=A0A4R6SS68_9SPHI|nr:histidine kinase [Pedobacter metabolipauper]TDQ06621.1 histidine kinase [Pedobacter metabolipauper]